MKDWVYNVRSEKNNTKHSSVLLLRLVFFFSEQTLLLLLSPVLQMNQLNCNFFEIVLKKSFEYVDSWAKIFLILYPPLENSATRIAIFYILHIYSLSRHPGPADLWTFY